MCVRAEMCVCEPFVVVVSGGKDARSFPGSAGRWFLLVRRRRSPSQRPPTARQHRPHTFRPRQVRRCLGLLLSLTLFFSRRGPPPLSSSPLSTFFFLAFSSAMALAAASLSFLALVAALVSPSSLFFAVSALATRLASAAVAAALGSIGALLRERCLRMRTHVPGLYTALLFIFFRPRQVCSRLGLLVRLAPGIVVP